MNKELPTLNYQLVLAGICFHYFNKSRDQITRKQDLFLTRNWTEQCLNYMHDETKRKSIAAFLKYYKLRLKLLQPPD